MEQLIQFLQAGGRVIVSVFGKDNVSKSGKVRFSAATRITLAFGQETLAYIRGNLKEFPESGGCRLDLSNSDNAQYPNSGIGKSLQELVNTASIAKIRNTIGANGSTSVVIGHDGEKFTYTKAERQVVNLELSEMSAGFAEASAMVAEQRQPKAAPAQAEVKSAEAAFKS